MEFFPYTESTSSTRLREELKKRILYHEDDVMSFDVFDTLVTRKVATPRGIFALVQEALADENLLPGLPDEQEVPFGLANRYPVGVLAEKIALYGAGRMGRDIYELLRERGKEVVCWVDKQAEALQGLSVETVEGLHRGGFEQLVIAVKSREKADEIRGELMAMGIAKETVFWSAC